MSDSSARSNKDDLIGSVSDILEERLLNKSVYVFWADVDNTSCSTCASFLLDALLSKKKNVTLIIDSNGGSTDDATGLLSIMEMCKASGMTINTIGVGSLASSGFWIFASGSLGYRYIHEYSVVMIHSTAAQMRNKREVELSNELDAKILANCAKFHRNTREKILNTGDHYYSSEDAIKYGIADHLIKIGEKYPIKAK